MDFNGNQTVQGPNESFSAASKGFFNAMQDDGFSGEQSILTDEELDYQDRPSWSAIYLFTVKV